MVKDKYSLAFSFIFIVLIFYIGYLIFDKYLLVKQRHTFIDNQIANMQSAKNTDGLLVGGSNVFFSLSAKDLTSKTNLKWLNVAIPSEGHSNSNYWSFIERNLSNDSRREIKTIIYSPVSVMAESIKILDRFDNNKNIIGDELTYSFSNLVKPSKSLAFYVKAWLKNEDSIKIRRSNSFGDLDFSTVKCDADRVELEFKRSTDQEIIKKFINAQLDDIYRLFPNADVYFIVPSMFYGEFIDVESNNLSDTYVEEAVSENNKKYSRATKLLVNQLYPSKSYICDGMHHANPKGRKWRTEHLIEQIGF